MELDHLTIHHQDGDCVCRMIAGGYRIEDGLLAVSVETQNTGGSHDHIELVSFSFVDHPIRAALAVGDTFEATGPPEWWRLDGTPTAFGYFGVHAMDVVVRATVIEVGDGWVEFGIEAEHDDINYYNELAKRTTTTGRFRLPPAPPGLLWIPC